MVSCGQDKKHTGGKEMSTHFIIEFYDRMIDTFTYRKVNAETGTEARQASVNWFFTGLDAKYMIATGKVRVYAAHTHDLVQRNAGGFYPCFSTSQFA